MVVVMTMPAQSFGQPGNNYLKNTLFSSAGNKGLISFLRNYTVNETGIIKNKFSSPLSNSKVSNISYRSTSFNYPLNSKSDIGIAYYPPAQLILYAKLLKQYALKHGYDTTYTFLCNMGLVSNKKRFYVFNMVTMRIENAGLVAQGRGNTSSIFDKQYSNVAGSNCTALGKYKISGSYSGEYGDSYKMYGLDSTNKKAYARRIVLHAMPCIPDSEAAMPPCASEGCPAVSPAFFSTLKSIIDSREKPILMWIFDSNLGELVVGDE